MFLQLYPAAGCSLTPSFAIASGLGRRTGLCSSGRRLGQEKFSWSGQRHRHSASGLFLGKLLSYCLVTRGRKRGCDCRLVLCWCWQHQSLRSQLRARHPSGVGWPLEIVSRADFDYEEGGCSPVLAARCVFRSRLRGLRICFYNLPTIFNRCTTRSHGSAEGD